MRDDEAVDRRAEKLSALLRATDLPAPAIAFPAERIARARRQRVVVRWRMAAAIGVLVGGPLLVSPVRAWIVETARSILVGTPRSVPAPAATPDTATTPAILVPTNVVTFVPRAGLFVLELASRQAAGTLRLARAPGAEASAALIGNPGDAELLVRPDGLRIGNRAGASADYVVRLPAGLTRVMLRIGREPARQLAPPTETDLDVPLGLRADRPE
jgi:hypothetical protein